MRKFALIIITAMLSLMAAHPALASENTNEKAQAAFIKQEWSVLSKMLPDEVEWLERKDMTVDFDSKVSKQFALGRLKAIREDMNDVLSKSMRICSPTLKPNGLSCGFAFQFNVQLELLTFADDDLISSIGVFRKVEATNG